MPYALGTCAGHHKPQAGWCHLERPSHPQVFVLSAALHCQNRLEKEPCSVAELGRMSLERVRLGCPHIHNQDVTTPQSRHVNPLPVPWVPCIALGKTLPAHCLHEESKQIKFECYEYPPAGNSEQFLPSLHGSAPREAGPPSLSSPSPGTGHEFSGAEPLPSYTARQHPAPQRAGTSWVGAGTCLQRAVEKEADPVQFPAPGLEPVEARTELGFLPAARHGSSWGRDGV